MGAGNKLRNYQHNGSEITEVNAAINVGVKMMLVEDLSNDHA